MCSLLSWIHLTPQTLKTIQLRPTGSRDWRHMGRHKHREKLDHVFRNSCRSPTTSFFNLSYHLECYFSHSTRERWYITCSRYEDTRRESQRGSHIAPTPCFIRRRGRHPLPRTFPPEMEGFLERLPCVRLPKSMS